MICCDRQTNRHFIIIYISSPLRPSSPPAQALLLTGSPCLFSSVTSASPSTGNKKKDKKRRFKKQKEKRTKQKYKRTNGHSHLLHHQQMTKHIDKVTKRQSDKKTKGQKDKNTREKKTKRTTMKKDKRTNGHKDM